MVQRAFPWHWVLFGIVIAGLPVIFATSFATAPQAGPRGANKDACPTAPPGIEAELEVSIDNKTPAAPRAVSTLVVSLPHKSSIAWDLPDPRDDPQYRLAMRCVLGATEHDWRQDLPSAVKEGERIIVRDTAQAEIALSPGSRTQVGLLTIHTISPESWHAEIARPLFLTGAHWRKVSVVAPPSWLSKPVPYLTATIYPERIQWQRPPLEKHDNDSLVSFTVQPDGRVQATALTLTARWRWALNLLYGLSTIILVGLPVLCAHQRGAKRIRRLLLPALVAAVVVTAGWIYTAYDGPNWFAGFVSFAVIIGAAIAWGVAPWLAGAVALAAGTIYGSLYFSIGVPTGHPARSQEALTVVAWHTAAVFPITVLLVAGAVNAARALYTGAQSLRPPPWVWYCGIVAATVLMAERFVNARIFLAARSWADSEPLLPVDVAWVTSGYFANVSDLIDRLLPILAAIGIWALLRDRFEGRLAILLFLIGPVTWDIVVFGLWLPVWPIAWLVLTFWLRSSRPLLDESLAGEGSTVRSVIAAHSPEALRAAAGRWRSIRQRGRGLDRDLAKGTIEVDAHVAETRKLLWSSLLPGENVQSVDQLRAAAVTPVDVVLNLGPRLTALENAKRGAVIATFVGVPATGLRFWLTWKTWPPTAAAPWNSVLLESISVLAWHTVAWMAAGAALGLLWQKLPFRRGLLKTVPLIASFAAVEVLSLLTVKLVVGGSSLALVDVALFTIVITVTALFMDLEALRPTDTWWSRRRDALAAAYGLENLTTQVAFLAAQATAILAIVSFVTGGAGQQAAVDRNDRSNQPPATGQSSTKP